MSGKKFTYTLTVCLGGRCFQGGGQEILKALEEKLSIQEGQTRADGLFHLEVVRCMNSCPLGPNIAINGEKHHQISPSKAIKLVETLEKDSPRPLKIHAICPFCQKSLRSVHSTDSIEIRGYHQEKQTSFLFHVYPSKIRFQKEPPQIKQARWSCPFCSTPLLDGALFCRYCQKEVLFFDTEEGKSFWICPDSLCGKWAYHQLTI